MDSVRKSVLVGVVLVSGGCFAAGGGRAPQPDAASPRWRALLGCYQVKDGQFALDSVPDARLNADRPGVRRAHFAPTPPIVGGYWFVTERGVVWVVRHDGLWGRSYELTARGDTLSGREHVCTDVVHDRTPAGRAVAVRTTACQVRQP